MKGHLKHLFTFGFLVVFICFGVSAADVPADVLKAAEKGVTNFPGLTGVELQQGFRVYTVSPASLMECDGLETAVTPTGMWRFLVTANGQPTGLLTVAQVNGEWTAVSFGGAGLAGEVSKVMAKWPTDKGYGFRFVRIYQARADFVEISNSGSSREAGFVPLTASRLALGLEGEFDPQVLLYNSEIITPLRDVVSRNMKLDETHRFQQEQ
jgi:hypothetical protein